ncbi:hypothetical protein KUL113_03760 [Tenacibaculum sp. KUL113]|nr:hypothetical protein KUL113_03760 [Tenacibaculum sp. KUL113]
MYSLLSKSLFAVGIPTIPLFKTSKLPAIPKDKIQHAAQELHQKNWQVAHADKLCGIALGQALINEAESCLVALKLDHKQADLKLALSQKLPSNLWVVSEGNNHYLIFKAPAPSPCSESLKSFTLFASGEESALLSFLCEDTFVVLSSPTQTPTEEVIQNLPVFEPHHIMDLVQEIKPESELQKEAYSAETKTKLHTLGQLDVIIRSYLAHFCYDFLLNCDKNTSILPVLQEIEALYDSFSANFVNITPNHQKEAYFQGFYSLIHQVRMYYNLRLPPNWDDHIGAKLRDRYQIPFTSKDTQYTYERLQQFVFEKMSEAIGNETQMLEACQSAMEEIARSFTVTKLEVDQLKRYISRQSGMKLNMTKMDSQITNLRKQAKGVLDLPSIVSVVIQFLSAQTEHRFDSSIDPNRLFRWMGTHWEPVEDHEISNIINTYFPSNFTDKGTRNVKAILTAIKNKLSLPLRRVSATGVNFNNGFVNPHLQLLPHDPDMGLTYTLPFTFKPEQIFPPEKLENFLSEIWENEPDNILALQEAMAATFFNTGTLFQRAILLHGASKSGKSQVLNIIRGLIPPQKRVSLAPNKWGDNDALAALSNKLLNLCGELSENEHINSQRFKDIVDGNEVTLKRNINQHNTLQPMATHWFASNHLPKTKDFTEGFTRRWLILGLEKPIPPEKRELDLGNKIVAEEKDKIISWAIQAYPRLVNNRDYTLSNSHHELVSQLGQMNNNVRHFFEASGYIELSDDSMIAVLKSLPKEELIEELKQLPSISGRDLYTLYATAVKEFKNGAVVDEGEFYRRTKELSGIYQFLQVVGRDSKNRLVIQYYGLDILLNG